jgi:ketosteroid isomerase-like protein
MTKSALHARLDTLYAAFQRGQIDFVLNSFDDDIEFISNAPIELFPFLGHRRGKTAVAQAIKSVHDEFDIQSYEPVSALVESEQAAVMLFARGISRKTGRSVQLAIAHFLKFRNDKIIELREFMDSFSAAEQMLGRALDIGSDYYLV